MIGKKIAIDLGTANSLVYLQGKGIILNEPTVVAYSIEDKKVLAIGNEAKDMLGKVPGNIVARRPMQHGVIAYYKLTEAYLKKLMEKALGRSRIFRPEVMVSVPAGITTVEERALIDALTSAGAGRVYMIPEPIAAALGAEMPIHKSSGNMIVNMGGGTSEIAILTLNGIVIARSERTAGDELNNSLINYIRKKYSLLIGEQMAEKIKMEIGSAIELENPHKMEVRGRSVTSGLPTNIQLTTNDLVKPLQEVLNKIILSIKEVLEKTPPELSSDIIDYGIVLSGGTANLEGIDELFSQALGVPFLIADDPFKAVVRGVAKGLENLEEIKRSLK